MPQLNHTIVSCRDKEVSARYLTETLGLPPATAFGPFLVVEMANGVSLDFADFGAPGASITPQHYAFLVTEEEFDQIFERIQGRGQQYWADPGRNQPGQMNRRDGGRGIYFDDPNGHFLEILTRPYGSGA